MRQRGESAASNVPVVPVLPAHRQVADQLQHLIVMGDLPAGTRLPSETDLAAQFGVSRNTLRVALKLLAERKLTRTSRGVTGGTFVLGPEPTDPTGRLGDIVAAMDSRRPVGRLQLLEARAIFEVETVRLAAARRNQGHLDLLRDVMDAPAPTDPSARFERHRAFHLAVTAAAQNSMLSLVIRPLFDALQTEFVAETADPREWEGIEAEHADMLEAIRAGDVPAAIGIATQHTHSVERAYFHTGGSGSRP